MATPDLHNNRGHQKPISLRTEQGQCVWDVVHISVSRDNYPIINYQKVSLGGRGTTLGGFCLFICRFAAFCERELGE